jgi:predicted TIM-barrel fold metal-dependent hydrolase
MSQLKIVDTHHHLWDLTNNYYPWLSDNIKTIWIGDYSSIRQDYLVKDYLEDCKNQNVVKSVHLQALWDPSDPVGETRWLQQCYDKCGYPDGIVAYANFAEPNVEEVLKGHCEYPNVKGIRKDLNWHDNPLYRFTERPDYMTDEQWLKGLALLEKYNLSFDLQIYSHQMREAAKVVERFPNIQFILTHAGMPIEQSEKGFNFWRENIKQLASLKNVAVKISGFGMFDKNWTVESIKPFVLNTIEIFGVNRCMFASNFPVEKMFSSYDKIFDAFKEIVKHFSLEDQIKMFHDNASRYYKL